MDYVTLFNSFEVNPHYLKRYLAFVLNCTSKPNNYTEKHHILPKSLFPEYKTDLKNLVKLTSRQHFVAHWILSKVFIKYKQKCSMLKAFSRMTSINKDNSDRLTVPSRLFELAKIANSTAMKLLNPMYNILVAARTKESLKLFYKSPKGIELRKKQSESRKGINNISPEGIKRLSDLWMGVARPKTKEHTELIKKNTSIGNFITPFGIFTSAREASLSEYNSTNLSRHMINKFCKTGNTNGFSFESNGKVNKMGIYKRKIRNP